MTTENARELFPGWAEAEWKEIMEDKDPVKIWEPRRRTKGKEAPKEEKKTKKMKRPDWDGIWFTIRYRLGRLKLKNPRAVGAILHCSPQHGRGSDGPRDLRAAGRLQPVSRRSGI